MSEISKEKNEALSLRLGKNMVAYLETNKIKLTAGELQTLEGLRGQLSDDGVLDGVCFFLNLRLRIEFCSPRSSISRSSLNTFLHSSCLFSCKRRKGINSIFGFFALSGRLDLLNSTCISLG